MTPQPGQSNNQPPYNQPPFNQGFPPPAASQSKVLAIISLVCGFLFPLGGIVLGIIALYKANKNPREYGGKGFAIGGIVAGSLLLIFTFAIMLFGFGVMIAALQEADRQNSKPTTTTSREPTTTAPNPATPTNYSLAATIPGGWKATAGAKYAFMKDGKFVSTNSKGVIAAYGSYTVADNQTINLRVTQDGQSGTGTMKVSVINNDTITILEGGTTNTLTRTGYDK